MYLLGRDGAYWFIDPHDAKNVRIVSSRFYSYSAAEIRAALFREFGKKFDVSGTGHYLVVHPKGQRNLWAQRFEDLYRNFTHYFRSRKIRIERPQFPLVAIVFHQRQDFLRYAGKSGINLSSRILGCYEFKSNRIMLYDRTAGREGRGWGANADVIIHEATHQMANNTGLHTRYGSTPVWVAEGLATMFEARGVWNATRYRQQSDRINQERLQSYRLNAKSQTVQRLAQLIVNDTMFDSHPDIAYSEAWALTFFLTEREPQKYQRYLKKTAARQPFIGYSSDQRKKDFTDVFGQDLIMLNARMARFIQSLK